MTYCRISSATKIISSARARRMRSAANGTSRRRGCAGICSMPSALPPNRPASNPFPTSTAATTKASAPSTSTRSAAGAGRRPAPSSSRCAAGVRWTQGGQARMARCRGEVILAAGSIGSPHIMLLSGVGPAQQLQELGIPVVLDRPGVGANLQDHLQLRMIYKVDGITTLNERYHARFGMARMLAEFALLRRGPLTMAPSQLGLFTRSDRDQDRANLQYHVQPLSLDRFGEPLHTFPAFTASVCNVRPTSRGSVRLRSRNPVDAPRIKPNYLATDEDRRTAANAIRLTRRIVAQPALKDFHPDEYLPGPQLRDDDEQALIKAAGDIGTTIFHPIGTAKMGLPSDPMTVVDDRLRVAGIERLRVVDASVMPTITSGNTNAPTMMIAEKGAALLRADAHGLAP